MVGPLIQGPAAALARPEPGLSQGYHPRIGRERPRSACGTGRPHGAALHQHYFPPAPGRDRLQLWRLTAPLPAIPRGWAPGPFIAGAGPDLTVSPSARAHQGPQGATVERPHVMYRSALGGAPRAGALGQKNKPSPLSAQQEGPGQYACETQAGLTAHTQEITISGCRGRHPAGCALSSTFSIARAGRPCQAPSAYLFRIRPPWTGSPSFRQGTPQNL